jgi:hypothetical protein
VEALSGMDKLWRHQPTCNLLVSWLVLVAGCGSSEEAPPPPAQPWGQDVTVIGPDGEEKDYTAAEAQGQACIAYDEGGECIRPDERCGPGVPADVILDAKGHVIDVVCYPTTGTLTPEQIEARQGDVAQNQNGAVIVLDGAVDGIDLNGNLAVDANQVVVYGYGPDQSVMSGTLTVDGNNTIVRGVRVQGDLTVLKNDSVLVFCVIEGNVTVVGNNTRLSGCDIFGSVRIQGSNTQFDGNRVQGTVEDVGMNTLCDENSSFVDLDRDRAVDPEEVGAAVGCS